ncbi:lipoate--protein ligase family protein [Synechocystis sp. PCC 7509]|uniref:lipoate--protein ligase family protein n=1 Tax=Synechocystis sp. PCC 7509 TaxID=927677 RepID=UPI00048D8C54|nr:biotin/lipoate A/B protein ligase family protein [Synechocystis sp. PCC 7509]
MTKPYKQNLQPRPIWRLIPLLEAPGRVQMAIDQWLVAQHQLGLHPPTLRFYTWSPVAISLGYHQSNFPRNWQQITWKGELLELVRRPTGGRAVLHQGDLTYAVVTSGLNGSRMQVYQQLCEFLIRGWQSLGIELQYGNAGRGYIHNPNCFGTATGADLVLLDGNKLIGSAQLKRGGVILQHGSMRLAPDKELFGRVFETEVFQPINLPLIEPIAVIEALTTAASNCFNIQLEVKPLSAVEWKEISSLL